MTNIIIPVNNEDMVEFCKKISKIQNSNIIIGVTENLKDNINLKSKNISIICFPKQTSKEEMIDKLKKYLDEGNLVIVRKNIEIDELKKFINSKYEITTCKKNRNKFQTIVFNFWQKVVKILFGFKYFEGDVSVISFSESLFPVINNIDSLSSASRVDKWKGVNIGFIDSESAPAKKEYNKVRTNLMLFGWITLFLAIIASTVVFFTYVKATFIYALLFACAIILGAVGVFVASAIYDMNIRIGQKKLIKKEQKNENN